MLGEYDVVDVATAVPPVDAVYQLTVPDDAVAPRVTVPGPHTVAAGEVAVIVGATQAVTTAPLKVKSLILYVVVPAAR
jgi:hypothetical protein